MKTDWEVKTLGEVCEIDNKRNTRKGIPYVGLEDIESNSFVFLGSTEPKDVKSSTFHFDNQHILYGRLRPYLNKVILPSFEGHCSTEIFPIKVKSIVLKKYVFYWITSDFVVSEINNTCTGARMPRANMNDILELEIPLPPIAEQQRIVAILDEAFAAISTAKENAQKNLQNARELFDSYLLSVFANPGEDWEEKTLGKVCEFKNGQAHEKIIDENGQFRLVNSRFISTSGEDHKRTSRALSPLFIDDIALVMSDVPKGKTLAKCFLVDQNNLYSLNQRVCVIRSDSFLPRFLFYQLNRHKYLLEFDNGENQTNLRKNDILACPLFVPSLSKQESVINKLDALTAETKKLEAIYQQKLTDLDELKKAILQKAFRGELTATSANAVTA